MKSASHAARSVLARSSSTLGRHYYGSAIEQGLDPAACLGLTAAGLRLAAAGCALFERRDVGA